MVLMVKKKYIDLVKLIFQINGNKNISYDIVVIV